MKRSLMLFAAVALLGGCGGTSDSSDPAGVTETFYNAIGDGDGETACAQLSPEGLGNIPENPDSCASEVSQLSEEDRAKVEEIESYEQVTGDTEFCGTISESDTNAEVLVTT